MSQIVESGSRTWSSFNGVDIVSTVAVTNDGIWVVTACAPTCPDAEPKVFPLLPCTVGFYGSSMMWPRIN